MLACFIKYFLRKINVLQLNIIISQLSILLFIFLNFSELNIDAFCTQFICLSVCESQAVWARVCRFASWGRFPFVRTDRQGHSRRNENFSFNQSYLAWSVKSWIACTKEIVFHQKLLKKAYFIFKMTSRKLSERRLWLVNYFTSVAVVALISLVLD